MYFSLQMSNLDYVICFSEKHEEKHRPNLHKVRKSTFLFDR